MVKKMIVLSFLILILIFTGTTIFANMLDSFHDTKYQKKVDVKSILMEIRKNNPFKVEIENQIRQNKKTIADKIKEDNIIKYKAYLASLIPIEEPVEEPVVIHDPEAPLEGKYAYLTFDDGPSKVVTTQILDILDEYDVKATFFVLGYMIDRNPDVLKDVYNRGHTIGNHTYSHDYGYIYYNTKNFIADIKRAEDTIKSHLGETFSTKIMRFPGGSHASFKKPMINAVLEEGYKFFDWNSLNGDSEEGEQSVTRMYNRFLQTVGKRDVLIVLMHDTDVKQLTVNTLPLIIQYLRDNGYKFNTLDKYNH